MQYLLALSTLLLHRHSCARSLFLNTFLEARVCADVYAQIATQIELNHYVVTIPLPLSC